MTKQYISRPRIGELMESEAVKKEKGAYRLHSEILIEICLTASAVVGARVYERLTKIIDMVRLSARSEWREQYGLIHDYSKDRDTLSACESIEKQCIKYAKELWNTMCKMKSVVDYKQSIGSTTANFGYDNFYERIDVGESMFDREYSEMKKAITDGLREYKATDPKMLYELIYSLCLSIRYEMLFEYIEHLHPEFGSKGSLHHSVKLRTFDYISKLIDRCHFETKDGSIIKIICSASAFDEWQKLTQKKSWKIKNRDVRYKVIDTRKLLCSDRIDRIAWQIESRLFEFETIDKIIIGATGQDPKFRNIYSRKRVQSSMDTYEVTKLNFVIKCGRYEDFVWRMKNYIESRPQFIGSVPRNTPKPVVMIRYKCERENEHQEVETYTFLFVFNSTYRAMCDTGTPFWYIKQSLRTGKPDPNGVIWLTLPDFITFFYLRVKDRRIGDDIQKAFYKIMNYQMIEDFIRELQGDEVANKLRELRHMSEEQLKLINKETKENCI